MVFYKRIRYLAEARSKITGIPSSTRFDGPLHCPGTNRITIGEKCFLGPDLELDARENGRIDIGASVRINRGVTIASYSSVRIGDHCLIGEFVSIRDANHGIRAKSLIRYQNHTSSPITIGEGAWIGRGSCILPGVTLGAGCVVGANSVVTRDVEAGAIVAGVPAKFKKFRMDQLPDPI